MTPEQIQAYRELFLTLCDYACNSSTGRDERDPVYIAVTENRDGPTAGMRQRYSSCADLAHWAWYRLGFRCEFLNRQEFKGWKSGVNLNRWCPTPIGPCPYARRPRIGEFPEAGDVLVVNNQWGGHVLCVRGYIPDTGQVYTAEYGQPGGKQGVRALKATAGGTLLLGAAQNPVISHVSLSRALALETLAPPDLDVLKDWQAPEALESLRIRIAG